jgi:YD repeat-containing protein
VRKTIPRCLTLLLILILNAQFLTVSAQQGTTNTYVYDAKGRLHAVIAATGEAVVYEYDSAGNITAIRRLPASALAILSFSPHEGLPGDQVTFIGVGFGGGVTNVSFNGASATIVSVSPSRVVATVPATATTGLVTITTPTGSASTDTPFTIAGMRVTPAAVSLRFGESIQFEAQVLPLTLDQEVRWSVENIVGGNTTVGTISAGGLYTAPNTRFSSLTITATSVADNTRFAEAHVRVTDPNDIQSVIAAAVSVRRGDTVSVAGAAPPVTVQYGKENVPTSASSSGVSVQYGKDNGPRSASTAPVSVQRAGDTVPVSGVSRSVSVQRNDTIQVAPTTFVSTTMGPYIQSVSQTSINRGTSITLTLNGIGLTGASALRFVTTATGALDANVVASNITVNGDGTSLTATITINASATLGTHVIVVATPAGDSIGVDFGNNIVNVVP